MALSIRQRKFAKLVASGMAQPDARIAAYGESYPPISRKSHAVQASRIANRPEVKEAIAQYEEELMPIGTYRALRQEMESNIRLLARESPDHRVRLAASKVLHDIAERREEREERNGAHAVTVDRIMGELAALAPASERTLELEASEASEEV